MLSMLLRALSVVTVCSLLLLSACGGEAIIDTNPDDEWSPVRLMDGQGEEGDVGEDAGADTGEGAANETGTFEVEEPGESL